ncbi:FxSxx-COOH system tetratricopeptide repeat protein [Actinoplanes sp. NPDC051494]|uniref:FxSxx-COOH system tetratricopeptide repeat protein n=1 Tax=Actinoplanes sp. NPDC051494 TaxID=3363907 RepID=UPI0037A8D944
MVTAPGPDGPLGDLVLALKELHRSAGKPGVRRISIAIRDRDDLRDTVSHETVGAMLRGSGLPKWVKVECVVRQLADWSVTGLDADQQIRRFHRLWLAADDEPGSPSGPPPAPGSMPAATTPMITNGPPRVRHFTGRTGVLSAIRSALTGSGGSPLSLIGLGGVGKTQLTVEYVHRWAADYDLVWWVPAEQPSQAMAALVALGDQLGLPPAADMRQTLRGVLTALEESALRWLLVYDNADQPSDLGVLMPATGGHVVVTTRNAAWSTAGGSSLPVAVFTREESVVFLREWGVEGSTEDCHAMADQLGDLPLALDQVGAMQTATGIPVREYLRLFAEHFDELLADGRQAGSRTTVTTSVNVAVGRLRAESVAAAQLLELLSFMAPVPVSLALLHRGRDGELSPPLGRALFGTVELERIAAQLGRYGLAQISANGQQLQVHRLVQRVVRDGLPPGQAQQRRLDVHRLLDAADPGSPDDSRTWNQHGEIGPHLIAADTLHAIPHELRQAVLDQIRYLERIGDFGESARLARDAVGAWRSDPALGPEHPFTVRAIRHLANALRALGSYQESHQMIIETLDLLRTSAAYGEEHQDTLATGGVAAFYLRLAGRYNEALDLDRRRVGILRRLYGDHDMRTTLAVTNLGVDLRLVGDAAAALELDTAKGHDEESLLVMARNQAWDLLELGRPGEAVEVQQSRMPRSRRHDDVALAKRAVAVGLRRLGRHQQARAVATEVYRMCQERFGPDHHLTLAAIMTYANTLRVVGDAVGARSLATEAYDRYRRLFGDQNPLTLAAATNLAVVLRALGQWRAAYSMDEVTHEETVRALGAGHPHALVAAMGLATDLAHHHADKDAAALGQATVDGLRRVRGEDHPETLACAVNLARDREPADPEAGRDAVRRLSARLGSDHPEVRAAIAGTRLECDIEPPPT